MFGTKNSTTFMRKFSSCSSKPIIDIWGNGDSFAILLVCVDDLLSLPMIDALNDSAECDLKAHFDIKSLGLPRLLLRIQINIEPHTILLSQSHYVVFLLEKYGVTEAKPISIHQEKDLGSKAPQVNPYFSGLNKYSQSYVGIDQVSL